MRDKTIQWMTRIAQMRNNIFSKDYAKHCGITDIQNKIIKEILSDRFDMAAAMCLSYLDQE